MSQIISLKNRVSPLRILLAIHEQHIVKAPFVHALQLAYASRGVLEIVDVRPYKGREESPGVREYLEKWGILSPNSKRSDVATTGLRVKRVMKPGNQKRILLKRLKRHSHDLLIVGTERQSKHGGILGNSLAAYLANYFRHTTLFLPSDARPFIDEATGTFSLNRVVMPIESEYFFSPALKYLHALLALFPEVHIEVIALHVGKQFPLLSRSEHPQISWKDQLCNDPVVTTICKTADNNRADLVIMSTNGRDTIAQKMIGSNTEQVLRNITCPVVSVSVQ